MREYRYIMYCYTPMPGDTGVNLRRARSQGHAIELLREFERQSGFGGRCA